MKVARSVKRKSDRDSANRLAKARRSSGWKLASTAVERAQDPVELGFVDGHVGELAAQVDPRPRRRSRSGSRRARRCDAAAGRPPALVLLGSGQHVRLVPQRPLAERQPHGDEVLLLAAHADEPARARRAQCVARAAIDGGDRRILAAISRRPTRRHGAEIGKPVAGVQVRHWSTLGGCERERQRASGDGLRGRGTRERSFLAHDELSRLSGRCTTGAAVRRRPTCSARPPLRPTSTPPAADRRARDDRGGELGRVAAGIKKPVRPWSTSDCRPATALATTGMPHAAASSATNRSSAPAGTMTTSAAR